MAATTTKKPVPAPSPFDLRKTLTDAGYIAVGLGVLGVQQAQSRRHQIQEQLEATTAKLREQAQARQARVQALPSKVSEQLGSFDLAARLETVRTRANEIGEQTRARVAPVIEQIESRVNELPAPLPTAAAPVVRVAKQFVAA